MMSADVGDRTYENARGDHTFGHKSIYLTLPRSTIHTPIVFSFVSEIRNYVQEAKFFDAHSRGRTFSTAPHQIMSCTHFFSCSASNMTSSYLAFFVSFPWQGTRVPFVLIDTHHAARFSRIAISLPFLVSPNTPTITA